MAAPVGSPRPDLPERAPGRYGHPVQALPTPTEDHILTKADPLCRYFPSPGIQPGIVMIQKHTPNFGASAGTFKDDSSEIPVRSYFGRMVCPMMRCATARHAAPSFNQSLG